MRIRALLLASGMVLLMLSLAAFFYVRTNYFFPDKRPVKHSQVAGVATEAASIPVPDKIKLPVIMYHYVETVKNPKDIQRIKLSISPRAFETQLKELKEASYSAYFVSDIPKILNSQVKPSDRSIALTFDDGYEDIYTTAFPLLKKYQTKGTIFLVTNFIGKQGFMTKSQIDEMLQSGLIEVGAHTLNHADLAKSSPEKARKEIFDSKKILENTFNIKVTSFAYPGGSYNDKVVELMREAQYDIAVTTKPGIYHTKDKLLETTRLRSGYLFLQSITQFFNKFTK